jgi:prostaglandin-E synthase 1
MSVAVSASNPVFTAYAIATIVLCLNMLVVWVMSGGARGKSKTTMNPEDAKTVSKGSELVAAETPEVARVLRAHRNAADNITPFLFLGAVYVALGPSVLIAQILFGVFTVARVGHTIAYLNEKQPWRTLIYFIGVLCTLGMIGDMIRLLATR